MNCFVQIAKHCKPRESSLFDPNSTLFGLASFPNTGFDSEVAHTPVAVPIKEFQLGHGSAKFQKPDKIAAMKREGKAGRAPLHYLSLKYCTCHASHHHWLIQSHIDGQDFKVSI